jgi:Flp pilus assembly protein TadB
MRGYLTILAHEIRSEGIARAMVKAIDRVADPLFDTLATAILVQSEKGAELSEALQVTIKNIENGAILIRRASSLRLQANMSAIIVPIVICSLVFGLMLHDGRPFAIGGNCAQLGGSYFSYYYTMPWTCPAGYGQFIAMGVVLLFVVGFFVMRQIQKIPPPPRVKLRQR